MLSNYTFKQPFWVFLSVLMAILLSKSLYFESYGENILLFILLGFLLFIYVFKKTKIKIELFLFSLILVILVLINPSTSINSFYVLIVRIFIGIFFVSMIPLNVFLSSYVKIILFLSIVSWFSIFVIYFDLTSFLPNFTPIDERVTRNFIFFGVWESFVQNLTFRNSGLWWEPGAFQVFVNLAFIFQIILKSINLKSYIIFLITLITISSTTGFVVFILLSFGYYLSNYNFQFSLKGFIYILFILLLGFIFYLFFLPNLFEKFDSDSQSYVSFLSRYYDLIISFNLWVENLFLGYGYGSQLEVAIPFGIKYFGNYQYSIVNPTGADGLTMFISQTGILGFFFIYIFLFPNYMYFNKKILGFIFSICLILMFNTENLSFTVLFVILLFYSFQSFKSLNRETK